MYTSCCKLVQTSDTFKRNACAGNITVYPNKKPCNVYFVLKSLQTSATFYAKHPRQQTTNAHNEKRVQITLFLKLSVQTSQEPTQVTETTPNPEPQLAILAKKDK